MLTWTKIAGAGGNPSGPSLVAGYAVGFFDENGLDSAAEGDTNFPVMSDAQAGDLILFHACAGNAGGYTFGDLTSPYIRDTTWPTYERGDTWYDIVDGSSVNPYFPAPSAGKWDGFVGICALFRGVSSLHSITRSTTNTPAANAGGALTVIIGIRDSDSPGASVTPPSGYTMIGQAIGTQSPYRAFQAMAYCVGYVTPGAWTGSTLYGTRTIRLD